MRYTLDRSTVDQHIETTVPTRTHTPAGTLAQAPCCVIIKSSSLIVTSYVCVCLLTATGAEHVVW